MAILHKFSLIILFILTLGLASCEAPYQNPLKVLTAHDLVGEWEANYGSSGTDKLIFYEDGTFKQVYKGPKGDYHSQRNTWWLERLADGFARIHLPGAHYYAPGSNNEFAPSYVYDPFLQATLELDDELVLHIRLDSSGKLLLHHLFLDSDEGFPIVGANTLIFRHIAEP